MKFFALVFMSITVVAPSASAHENVRDVARAIVEVARNSSVPRHNVSSQGGNAKHQLAMVISGGASMGTYQAGFMHFTGEVVKRLPDVEMRLFTGASAGSANAFISAINSCAPSNNDPLQDIGYRVWRPVGYNTLFNKKTVTAKSVFSRQTMIDSSENIWEAIRAGFPEECDVVFGVTTTRVEAERVELVPGLSVPYPNVQFAVRIRGRGVGKPPVIDNYVDYFTRLPRPVLPFQQEHTWEAARHNYEVVRDVVYASMAYPVAFAPVTIKYCPTRAYDEATQTAGPFTCTDPTKSDVFVDGGVYDNNPLRLALSFEKRGLRVQPNGDVVWKDTKVPPSAEKNAKFEATQFVYVDHDLFAYPTHPPRVRTKKTLQLLEQLSLTAENFIETSRSRELFALVSEDQSLRHRMRLTQVNFPTVSHHVSSFLGLLEGDFRFFDFYLGMYDGLKSTRRAMQRAGKSLRVINMFGLHEDPALLEKNWRPFACLVSYYEPGFERYRVTCEGDRLRNFRALAQLSIDRVYAQCSVLNPKDVLGKTNHYHCLRALRGLRPPRIKDVPPLDDPDDWRKPEDENDFDHSMRLLTAYKFHYKDLGLNPNESHLGRLKIRRSLLEMIEYIADAQESQTHRAAILTLGRSAVNGIEYEPPLNWLYVLLGSATEVGMSIMPWEMNRAWLRLHWALQMNGIFSLLTQDSNEFIVAPMVGPEFQLLFMTNSVFQPIFGVRGGYQFSTHDVFHTSDCTDESTEGDQRKCSQAIVSPYLVLAVLERLRFQATLNLYPEDFQFDDKSYDVLFGIGAHFF